VQGELCGTAYGYNNGDVRGSVEANLDVQYIMATGTYIDTYTYKLTGGNADIVEEMLEYAYIVLNQTDPALVHSISYGAYGGSYDNATDHQFDHELAKMGLAGISVSCPKDLSRSAVQPWERQQNLTSPQHQIGS